ncbi:MAG: hypothetical protein ACSHX0_12630 [Akkermansiaceae bacterium]
MEQQNLNSTSCGISLSHEDRIKLLQAGYHLKESRHIGLNIPSKLNYVYPDKIYAKHPDGEVWRIIYLGQPALLKEHPSKITTCGIAYGYPSKKGGGFLQPVNLRSVEFLEESEHPQIT